ncbi:transcription factor cwo isoform X2 [Photinus pyralis]|uniref:transcription factor cwo isoform X2 n=1 Tax=Photinus pyralis TaxID=7054 RepID=UPI001267408C|nr:transcription factor cwo isoform X2 [Photinus pyralis]
MMMDLSQPHTFWEESAHVKYEGSNSNEEHPRLKDERGLYSCCDGNFNFATAPCSEDELEYGNGLYKKNKVSRDPMSHRIIEKRRRDRMNNCLADLSRLIPAEYLKKGRGRIEKTEIIEMAIKYMKHLQHLHVASSEHYRLGYQECMSEAMRFLVEVEGHFPREAICIRLLTHLQKHCDTLSRTTQTLSPPELVEKVEEKKINEQIDLTKGVHSPPCDQFALKSSESDEKHSDGSASYKYKNDIKLRFSQDLNSATKKLKTSANSIRRVSDTSTENQSSVYSSPHSSNGDLSTRVPSEGDIPTNISRGYQPKSDSSVTPATRSNYLNGNHYPHDNKYKIEIKNFNIPIFVYHAKGSFYIPLTVDYFTLLPFLHNYNLMETFANDQDIVLHPVSINVSYHSNCTTVKYKSHFSPTWHQ